jgi:fatty-acid desaturase
MSTGIAALKVAATASVAPVVDSPPGGLSAAEVRRLKFQSETDLLVAAFHRDRLRPSNIDWVVTLFLIGVHAGAVAAFVPSLFSWSGLAICLGLHWLTCSIGICLGYHRYLSHKSLKLRTPAEFFVLACGCLSGEGSPLTWAATHRLHHQKSDHEGDPHSPVKDPAWWSHMLWLFPKRTTEATRVLMRRYCPELINRPLVNFFERTFPLWLWGSGLTLLTAGWLLGGWQLGLSWLVWGMCVRMVAAYHSTWFVNSATHLWGYRNYDTRDASRNLWWVAILAYGEGWHNNHHAHPSVAPAGHKWWEVDVTWWSIRLLKAVGLAWDVRDKLPLGRTADDVQDMQEIATPETMVA